MAFTAKVAHPWLQQHRERCVVERYHGHIAHGDAFGHGQVTQAALLVHDAACAPLKKESNVGFAYRVVLFSEAGSVVSAHGVLAIEQSEEVLGVGMVRDPAFPPEGPTAGIRCAHSAASPASTLTLTATFSSRCSMLCTSAATRT